MNQPDGVADEQAPQGDEHGERNLTVDDIVPQVLGDHTGRGQDKRRPQAIAQPQESQLAGAAGPYHDEQNEE